MQIISNTLQQIRMLPTVKRWLAVSEQPSMVYRLRADSLPVVISADVQAVIHTVIPVVRKTVIRFAATATAAAPETDILIVKHRLRFRNLKIRSKNVTEMGIPCLQPIEPLNAVTIS